VKLALLPGSANPRLALAIAGVLGESLARCHLEAFPDSEQHVEILESVRGSDVYVIQPTSPPVDSHLVELLLLGDAARRAGAGRITAVVPYFGYARQDRRAKGREPVTSRLVADLIQPAFDRVIALDVHTSSIEGLFRIPIEHLSAVPVLAEAVRAARLPKSVIVAPDLGAVKLAEQYAGMLDLPVEVVRKRRVSAQRVTVSGIVGEVAGRAPIIVDDMISALAVSIAVHCDGCISYHVHDALKAGATDEEICETIGVAVLMGGGPSVVYGAEAFEALEQFRAQEASEGPG